MNPNARDPSRRCLPYANWPAIDRRLWEKAIEDDGAPFDQGPAARWRPSTRHLVMSCYGRWLNFLALCGGLESCKAPAARLDHRLVYEYVDELRQKVRDYTVVVRIEGLVSMIRALQPDAKIGWLRRLASDLNRTAQSRKPRRNRIKPSAELYGLGRDLMIEANRSHGAGSVTNSIKYRDGLMIAFLAARPLRVSTFAGLQLERHILQSGRAFWLDIPGELTKTGHPIDMPLPADLTPYLRCYIDHHRKVLLREAGLDYLWISRLGTPLTSNSILIRVSKWTREAFGIPISPHLIRACAVTSVATQDPGRIGISQALLGHRSMATTTAVYNLASCMEAAKLYQAHICKRRSSA